MNSIKTLFQEQSNWFGMSNGYDCITFSNLSDSDRRMIRENFNIPINEEILFLRDTGFWNNKDQGTVITERGLYIISDNDHPEDEFLIDWTEFNSVVYKELVFYLCNGDEVVAQLGKDMLMKCDDDHVSGRASRIRLFLTKIAESQEPNLSPLDLIDQGKLEEAEILADSIIQSQPRDLFGYFCKGRAIYIEQCQANEIDDARVNEALNAMDSALEFAESGNSVNSTIYRNKAFLFELVGQSYNARNCYVNSLETSDNPQDDLNNIANTEEDMKKIWDDYTNVYDYKDRKFCMVVRDHEIGGCVVRGIDVFRLSNVPSAFKFPFGHPYPNQLYIAHPYNSGLYVPYDESEDIFFTDKVNELCYLLECLGAETIEISAVRGKRVEEMSNCAQSLGGSADIKLFSANGQSSQRKETNNSSDCNSTRTFTIRLDPMKLPYLPENLLWYAEQPQWQRLVERRLKNNILEYSESVQSSETRFTSTNEVSDIEVSAEYLWTKVKANVQRNIESQFKTSMETVWNIHVRFRSMKDFEEQTGIVSQSDQSPKVLTAEEKEYIDEFKFCLEEDGVISPKEERMLDRLRLRLGISENRAKELTKELKTSYTPAELEFIEEIKLCLEEDGRITEKDLRILSRMASRMGISSERAEQLRISIEQE